LCPRNCCVPGIGYRNGQKGWFAPPTIKDNDFAVSETALEGPDIWIDPIVGDALFLSDRLVQSLKKAKADKGLFLSKCRALKANFYLEVV
jgi:hypothetical protein